MRDASRNSAIGLENEWTREYWSLLNLKNRRAGIVRTDSMEEVHLEATAEQAGATRCISGRPTDLWYGFTQPRLDKMYSLPYRFDTVPSTSILLRNTVAITSYRVPTCDVGVALDSDPPSSYSRTKVDFIAQSVTQAPTYIHSSRDRSMLAHCNMQQAPPMLQAKTSPS
jgi:hypothetical protein